MLANNPLSIPVKPVQLLKVYAQDTQVVLLGISAAGTVPVRPVHP
jgi:hypothetical protein